MRKVRKANVKIFNLNPFILNKIHLSPSLSLSLTMSHTYTHTHIHTLEHTYVKERSI